MTALRIVTFGDSITHAVSGDIPPERRWPLMIEKALAALYPDRAVTVVNAGVGGNTSREGLARFERDVAPHQPDILLAEFGGNDATPEPERRVDLPEFERNLTEMRDRAATWGGRAAYLTFPPVIDVWHCWYKQEVADFMAAGGQDAFIERYRQSARTVAAKLGTPLIDIDLAVRQAIRERGAESQILRDGVHLSEGGNRTLATAVLAGLVSMIG